VNTVKLVLFDLGDTLEHDDEPLPGARDTLEALLGLRDEAGQPAVRLGLLSDFLEPSSPEEIPSIRRQYFDILATVGIRDLFEPVEEHVTLSTEVGARKPDVAMFEAAAAQGGAGFSDTVFVTENREHVLAARRLGLTAVHVKGPGQTRGDVTSLPELVPIVRDLVLPAQQVVVLRVAPDAVEGVLPAVTAAGASWTRLREELVVVGGADAIAAVVAAVDPADVLSRSDVAAGELRLVLQNGSLFQQEHPDVPVLAGGGRHLVVRWDPARRAAPHDHDEPCFAIRQLPGNTTVVAPAAALHLEARRAAPPAWVAECVDRLSAETFTAELGALVALPTRMSTSPGFSTAADLARDRLTALGYQVSSEPVPVGAGTSRNVIAERPGTGPEPRDLVVVTAHLDSINSSGGAEAPAPGADDNGSGSAGLLSIAAALAGHPQQVHDLRLILFGGEEQGLFGSRRHVARLPDGERARIRAVLNMDMIGTLNTPSPGVLLEGAAVSRPVIDGLAAAAATFTALAVTISLSPFNSDHVPFIDAGIPAVLTIEGADGSNHNVHTAADTLDKIDVGLALQILRANVAYLAETLGPPSAPAVQG
jgi:FMN phosphatase YigB (HAD superfamily)